MLAQYLTRTEQLLQNPGAPASLYSSVDLTGYINEARGQLAGTAECIRFLGALTASTSTNQYLFSHISFAGDLGVGNAIQVRNIWYQLGTGGMRLLAPRAFPWFATYELNNPVPQPGPPDTWSQFGQGVAGLFFIAPKPDLAYSLSLDCVCLPTPLASDADFEPIPALWTDAVPFLAAWFALLASQTGARQGDADRMFQRYQDFITNARRSATPDILPDIWDQSPSPVRQNQLGLAPHQRGAPPQGGGG